MEGGTHLSAATWVWITCRPNPDQRGGRLEHFRQSNVLAANGYHLDDMRRLLFALLVLVWIASSQPSAPHPTIVNNPNPNRLIVHDVPTPPVSAVPSSPIKSFLRIWYLRAARIWIRASRLWQTR
jgi:hypothetical protein